MPTARGRRPGSSTTREEILEAAKRQFADLGYPAATMRSIAREAGVDPRLVTHYFGSKQELFMAVFELPFVPDAERLDELEQAAKAGGAVGELFMRRLLVLLRTPSFAQAATGLVRAAATEPELALLVRRFMMESIVGPVLGRLSVDQNQLRAAATSTQITGLIMGLLIVGLDPLTEATDEQLVTLYGPTFDRYLRGDLG